MLLLDGNNATVDSSRKVVVISPLKPIQDELAELLRSHGVEYVEVVGKSFESEDISLDAEETVGVVIDIESDTNVSEIVERVSAIVPQKIWCCLVGESDSISLAQRLAESNILYFNRKSQLNLMVTRITASKMTVPTIRNTVKVCVLGCKGGIGATFVSAQIANKIAKDKKVPVLLVQGSHGSQDLDLLFDKKLQGDIVEFEKNLDIFMGDFEHLPEDELEKYNFIIYDQPIFNVTKDEYIHYFNVASSFVLVAERHPDSLRVAKRFMEQCERQRSNNNQLIRTFVCVEDSRLEHSRLMSKADIESLLTCKVDAIVPFLKNTNAKTVLDIKMPKSNQKIIKQLAMLIIGALSREEGKKEQSSLFKTIWQKLIS
ncbi:pilus assembly protein [Actinobacillus delphinicola]|uniref:pilus assembly protein n=1 Tax=Actinobacillus delphinicola TaxID=51161 RepID=UPI0024428575|nr:pilus assembly protein [Actinobacillus delphinicola]MDG6897054.1 pilus assembly protein [Actinobacillus delphinicola]